MQQDTQLLKEIIAVAQDGADFYDQAQDRVRDPSLRRLFGRMAGAKRELISSLAGDLRSMGAEPPRDGTALGALRETYARLRASLTRDDAKVYTDQLEEAEDRLLAHMREALRKADPQVRSQLEMHLPEVQACHDEMRNLKRRAGKPTVH